MASDVNVQKWQGKKLLFYSQYFVKEAVGDVLSFNVATHPFENRTVTSYCFPPFKMIGVVLNHIKNCRARCVMIVPDTYASWYPLLKSGMKDKMLIARKGDNKSFKQFHKGKCVKVTLEHDMIAVLVQF